MPDQDEIRLAAALAGLVTKDLTGAVSKNTNKIDPHRFIQSLGVEYPQAGVRQRMPTQFPQTSVPGMIEQSRLTPQDPQIVGKAQIMPDLIPIPEGLEKYVEEYTHIPVPRANGEQTDPQQVPVPEPEQQIITEPAPVPDVTILPNTNSFEHQVLARLDRIEQRIGLIGKSPKILAAIEQVLLNESKRNKQRKKLKTSPKVPRSLSGDHNPRTTEI